jgi:hypothetical protein
MTSAMIDMASQRAIQRAVFALIDEKEAQELNNMCPRDEDDGDFDGEELVEHYAEFAQEKLDNAENNGQIPDVFVPIVQACLEGIDWEQHPNFPG